MKDYYAILGVSTNADLEVINAAYRAMAKKYHPDVYNGDKKFAEEKIKDINEAFENLSSKDKRKAYDEKYNKEGNSGSFNDYNETSDENDGWYDDYLKDAWNIVTEYYPEAETERKRLAKLQKKLALQFQFILIETKSASKYKMIAKITRDDFFNRYFGEDKNLHSIVENLLLKNQTKIALEINKAIKVLGTEASKDIIKKIKNKYRGKVTDTNIAIYNEQAQTIEKLVIEFNFNKDEYDYEYNFDYDDEGFIIDLVIECFLEEDEDHQRPYPVVDYQINLKKQFLLDHDNKSEDKKTSYTEFADLINFLEEKFKENA